MIVRSASQPGAGRLSNFNGCRIDADRWSRLRVGLLALGLCVVSSGAGAESRFAAGITEPIADVMLSSSVPGIVSVWKFKEGEFVKENDVIIELDNRLEELEVERRKAVLDNRKSELESLRTLSAKSSISVKKEDLDKAETDFRIARAELEMAVEQLNRRRVVTPCAGSIVEIGRDPGEACQAYQPLIRVVDTRRCYFVCNVEAKVAGRFTLGQSVKLEIESAVTPLAIEGKISYLSPVVDPASGLQKIKALFDNPDGKIRPGIAGKLRLE